MRRIFVLRGVAPRNAMLAAALVLRQARAASITPRVQDPTNTKARSLLEKAQQQSQGPGFCQGH